jgi:hypothetical protein
LVTVELVERFFDLPVAQGDERRLRDLTAGRLDGVLLSAFCDRDAAFAPLKHAVATVGLLVSDLARFTESGFFSVCEAFRLRGNDVTAELVERFLDLPVLAVGNLRLRDFTKWSQAKTDWDCTSQSCVVVV